MRKSNEEAIAAWNLNAAWWDAKIGPEGNAFHRQLVAPTTEKYLNLCPGERVLEIACGNGQFARRMADLGASVVAVDASPVFIERALTHSRHYGGQITYHVMDATDEEQIVQLIGDPFDSVVANMALMDIADISPLASALPKLLKKGGRFVFSVMHPCFNSVGNTLLAEEVYDEGVPKVVYGIKTTTYLESRSVKGTGIIGQPVPHTYFHRSLSTLFTHFFQVGMVLDALAEPAFVEQTGHHRLFSWSHYQDIPPLLVASMRLV